MRPFTAFTASAAGVIIIAALGLTACSSATTTPTPLRLAAPTLIDCGDEPSERSRESVMVVNRTSAIVRVWTRGIDCYDWGGTSNPSRLDGIELSPGVSSAKETCNTVKGFSACIGQSLCAGPDYRERRVDAPLAHLDSTDAGRRIVITTYCSLADHQARMVLTDG